MKLSPSPPTRHVRALLRHGALALAALMVAVIAPTSASATLPLSVHADAIPTLLESHASLADPDAQTAQQTWNQRFDWSNEGFVYTIEILGAEAARTSMNVGAVIEHEEYGRVIPVDGITVSVGFFGTVYPMRDTALTYVDVETGLPVWTSKTLDERNEVRTYDVAFHHDDFQAHVRRTREEGTRTYMRYGPSDLHDAMSWWIDLRSKDLSVGQEYVYHVYDGWKLSRLTCRVRRHHDVYTPMGFIESAEFSLTREVLASFPALPYADGIPLPPVYEVTDGPMELGNMWISLDDRRLPVGAEIDAPIGYLRMLLERHEPPSP